MSVFGSESYLAVAYECVFGSESYLAVAYECVFMFVLNICQSEYCLTMSMFL